MSSLRKVHKLSIKGRYDIYNILEGLKALSKVHELHLEYCTVTDLHPLVDIHTLTLDCIKDISGEGNTDVSMLSSVNTLTLKYCQGIDDLSALHAVQELTLEVWVDHRCVHVFFSS